MADEEPQERYLFGGAFSARLPPGGLDISEMRQVPDNQEVFVHPSTDQSIIVELLEYQAGVADENAARPKTMSLCIWCCSASLSTERICLSPSMTPPGLNSPLSTSAAQSTEVPLSLSRPPWTVEHFHAFVCSLRLLDPGLFG
ncbi:hypothetical protein Chor_009644 [Crotalus horridus]